MPTEISTLGLKDAYYMLIRSSKWLSNSKAWYSPK